jgi:glycosyltransferase involved in cell wall biosynthesis
LHRNNKKIITLFAGSEVRYSNAFAQEYSVNIDKWEDGMKNDDLNEKMHFVRIAELYSDLILSVPDQSGLMLAPYDHFFLPLNVKEYSFRNHQRDIPHIIHAPTRTGAKGTEVFLEVIDKLKSEGLNFEFSFLQNLSHKELINKLSESDILLDELYFHGPGMMAAEAMACGCVVVTHKLKTNTHIFDPPVCDVNFEDLYTKLKLLIAGKSERERTAVEARKYVETFNDANIVAGRMLNRINEKKRDYSPSFYLNELILPQGTLLTENNRQLTAKVLKKNQMEDGNVVTALKARNLI